MSAPRFPITNMVANSLNDYIGKDFIIDAYEKIAGKPGGSMFDAAQHHIDSYNGYFDMFNDEIHQTARDSKPNLIHTYFSFLKELRERFNSWNRDYIESLMDEYNKEINEAFEAEVEKKADEYFSKHNGLTHLQEYETPRYVGNNPFQSMWDNDPRNWRTVKQTFYGFYEVTDSPQYIEKEKMEPYYDWVLDAINRFNRAIDPMIKRYDAGEFTSDTSPVPVVNVNMKSSEGTAWDKDVKKFKNTWYGRLILGMAALCTFIAGVYGIYKIVRPEDKKTDETKINQFNNSNSTNNFYYPTKIGNSTYDSLKNNDTVKR